MDIVVVSKAHPHASNRKAASHFALYCESVHHKHAVCMASNERETELFETGSDLIESNDSEFVSARITESR